MVFGSSQYGNSGLSGLRSALSNEGAISERMRLQHIKEEREKAIIDQAKSNLLEKKRILERNKSEISQRQTEARRLNSELTRLQGGIKLLESEIKEHDSKVTALKAKHADIVFEIGKLHEKMEGSRSQSSKQMHQVQHYASEINALELKIQREKDVLHQINTEMDAILVKIARMTNDANHAETELSKSESNKRYKEQEINARKRNFNTLNEKKEHELREVQRLTSENARLEQEIKQLEQAAHKKA